MTCTRRRAGSPGWMTSARTTTPTGWACCSSPTSATPGSPRSGPRRPGRCCAARWWRGCSARPVGGRIPATPRSRCTGRCSSPGCRGPGPPRCTGCWWPTRPTRAWSCGSPRRHGPGRPGRPGPQTRCSSTSRPPAPGTTSSIRSSRGCTTSRPTRSRSAGSCYGSRCVRSRSSAWPTCRGWVLKNPSHLFALDALLRVYPDALVIQTHRDPRTAIASVCSLAAQACEGWSETFRGSVIGRDQLALWASGLERFTAERARHDPARFYDVGYEEFTADPLGAVEAAYGYFGLPLSGAAADAMRSLIVADAAGRSPGHRYALADFGLTGAEVDERFAAIPGYEPSKR